MKLSVRCPSCGDRADRSQPAAPRSAPPGVFAIYPCGCWLTPVAAVALRNAYQALVDAARVSRSDDAPATLESVPALAPSGVPVVTPQHLEEDPWT